MPLFGGPERSRWARIQDRLGKRSKASQPRQGRRSDLEAQAANGPEPARSEEETVRRAIDEAMMAWRQEAEILRSDVGKAVQDLDRAERALRQAAEEAKAMLGREATRLRDEFRQERERSAAAVDHALQRIAGSVAPDRASEAEQAERAPTRNRW
ncbi:MAG: hypothetical protein ACJ75Z_05700 [Solirubrobacterales bacterium]